MSPNLEQLPTKEIYHLVSFSYGTTTWRITNANTNIKSRLGLFVSDPKMKITLPVNSIAGFGKAEARVTISTEDWPFASQLTTGRPFAPTTVIITEKSYSDVNDQERIMFVGRLTSAIRNPGGKRGLVEIKASGDKNDLDQALGFSCNETCGWEFGDPKTCTKNIVSLTETGTFNILDVKSPKVQITGLSAVANRFWHRGKVVRNGLKILIREWANGDQFILADLPPIDWNGQTVSVEPGCDKFPTTCYFWDQIDTFSGIGVKTLDYNPLFENP